jgi:hypothetical protein
MKTGVQKPHLMATQCSFRCFIAEPNTLVVCISKQQFELFDLFRDSSLVKRLVEKRRTHGFNYTNTTAVWLPRTNAA